MNLVELKMGKKLSHAFGDKVHQMFARGTPTYKHYFMISHVHIDIDPEHGNVLRNEDSDVHTLLANPTYEPVISILGKKMIFHNGQFYRIAGMTMIERAGWKFGIFGAVETKGVGIDQDSIDRSLEVFGKYLQNG